MVSRIAPSLLATAGQNQTIVRLMEGMEARRGTWRAGGAAWRGAAGVLFWLGAFAAAGLGTLALLSSGAAEPLVLALLVLLAIVGVFFVFGVMSGFVRLAENAIETDLARALADDPARAAQIIAADGSVAFSSEGLRQLLELGAGRVGPLEAVLAGEPQAAEVLFRLSRAAERREARSEELAVQSAQARRHRLLRISVKPLRVGAGVPVARPLTLWQVEDVTADREREAEALGKLQAALAHYDAMPAGLFAYANDGRITQFNATLAGWLGSAGQPPPPAGRTLADLFAPDAAAMLHAAGRAPSIDPQRLDIDMLTAEGRAFPARLLVRGGGKQVSVAVLPRAAETIDPADRRAAEARFSRLFNSAPLGIATVDAGGAIVAANAAFARMFPAQSRRAPRSVQPLLASDAQARRAVETAIEHAAAGHPASAPIEFTFGANGEATRRIYVNHLSASADGREAAILYVLDATEQKALELKFAQSQKMEAVGKLAGGIAHDFNNVLTAIIGFSDLLLGNQRPTDPAYRDIMNIKSSANRAAGLVRHLLAFSRRQTFQSEVLELGEVLTDLSPLLNRSIGEKVELKIMSGRDLWTVKADKTQVESAIINLAVNARDAMPDGGRLVVRTRNISERDSAKVGAQGIAAGEYVLIEVEDTGTGMTPEIMAKIFEPFFSTKDVGKGTGLGLSTVYGIVKQSGGYIYPESVVGRGTTFRLYLPRHVVEPGEEVVAPKPDKPSAPRDLTGNGRVLLVEDEDAVRAFAVRALIRQGYEVLEASTGVEALEVMAREKGRIDLVVSDVVMPEMDGPTMLKEMRKTNPDLRIIFMSGYPDDAFKKSLDEDDVFAFLSKPFNLAQLAAKVKEELTR